MRMLMRMRMVVPVPISMLVTAADWGMSILRF